MTSRPTGADDQLEKLGRRYFEAKHRADPFGATLAGLTEFDSLCPDPGLDASDDAAGTFAGIASDLARLNVAPESRMDHGVLAFLLRAAQGDTQHSLWAASLSTEGYVSRQGSLFQALPTVTLPDAEAAERYLHRLGGVAQFLDRLGERSRIEAARGRPSPRLGLAAAVRQLNSHQRRRANDDVLLAPTKGSVGRTVAPAARAVVRDAIRPAMRRLASTYEDLMPTARDDDHVGICFIDGGDDAYVDAVHRHTTQQHAPDDLHGLGLRLLDDLQGRWRDQGLSALGTSDAAAIAARMRDDPRGRFRSADEMVATTASALDRAVTAMHAGFGPSFDLPECRIEVIRPEDSIGAPLAYYRPPANDCSRLGALCLLTANPASRPRFEHEALTFHESVPGHHLQLVAAGRASIPAWRQNIDVELAAYTEGWGLYAEHLADELGLYSDEQQRLGMLSLSMLRAARVVVDTGIHALGWSRQRAEAFLRQHTIATEHTIRNEVQRYIAWPGQALAYATGRHAILQARDRARDTEGALFSLHSFHAALLGGGAVPLGLLGMSL